MRVFAVIAAVMVLAILTRNQTLPLLATWLDVGQQADNRDYAMLLNGDRDTRPFAVADLYHRGKAKRILITTSGAPSNQFEPGAAEVAHAVLTRCGVPDSKIDLVDARCDNTFDEARALSGFMRDRPTATFCVVTNTYHSRRSRWAFETVLGKEMSRVRFVSAPTDFYHAGNWWKHEDGFVAYLAEFLKAAFYFFRYGSGAAWSAGVVLLIGMVLWVRRQLASRTATA